MLNDQIIAAIRTASAVWGPALIVALVTTLTSLGVDIQIDQSWGVALAGLLFALLVGLYNFAVNWATAHVWSGFGWLLGVNKAPDYSTEGRVYTEPVDDSGDAVDWL